MRRTLIFHRWKVHLSNQYYLVDIGVWSSKRKIEHIDVDGSAKKSFNMDLFGEMSYISTSIFSLVLALLIYALYEIEAPTYIILTILFVLSLVVYSISRPTKKIIVVMGIYYHTSDTSIFKRIKIFNSQRCC